MDQYTIKICSLTQSPEKFLCLNTECQRNDKKYLQCYECLNKQHIGKNRVIKHLDDIIELDKFMKKIQEKNNKKEQFINQLILICNDFQKEKIQQIELTQKQDVATLARDKIESNISQFTIHLGQEIMRFKSFLLYSNNKHEQLIQCYLENEQIYIDSLKGQYKQMVEKVQAFVFSLDYDIKQQLTKLEDKVKCVNEKNKGFTYYALLLFITPLILSYFLNQQNIDIQLEDVKNKTNQKYYQLEQQNLALEIQVLQLKEQVETLILLNLEEMENTLQNIRGEHNITTENVEKLKLRFEAFKQNQQNQFIDLKKQIQQQIEIQDRQNETLGKLNNSFIEFKNHYDDNMSSKLLQMQPLSQKERLMIQYSDLIGKIHQNLNIKKKLFNFTLLYDHYFNHYVSISRMDKIYKQATQDSVICLGGLSVDNLEEFMLVACDFASEIFIPGNDITKARKSSNGDVYWYFVDYFSFGFSPKEKIFLTLCDNEDLEDELRFSYWFGQQGRNGGRRLGKLTTLENSLQHKMQIYMLK